MDIVKELFLFFIPCFRTQNFAIFIDDEGDWEIYCLESHLNEDDEGEYNAIGKVTYFTWLGLGFNLKLLDAWEV